MERMLVVVFDTENKAYEGSHALYRLDQEGSIAIHAQAIIEKNGNGTISIKKTEGEFPVQTFAGTAIGSLIGLLGGPVGLAVGAAVGATTGFLADIYVAGVNTDFLNDISARLTPGRFALVADISEEWVTPVDSTTEAFGGVVFRSTRAYVEAEQRAREIAELKADIEQMKAELSQARSERKAEIQAKLDRLNNKLHEKVQQARNRAEQIKNEADAKLRALQQKAAKAHRENKAAFETRIAEIREQYEQSEAKLKHATAEQLRKAAARLEKAG